MPKNAVGQEQIAAVNCESVCPDNLTTKTLEKLGKYDKAITFHHITARKNITDAQP